MTWYHYSMVTISSNEYMKTTLLGILPFFVIVLSLFFYINDPFFKQTGKPTIKTCPLEEKKCPDGSSVYRSGTECEFTACLTSPQLEETKLKVGQTGFVNGLAITFNSFVNDSRCPADVVCIQKGNITITVTIADEQNHTETITMTSDAEPVLFNGNAVRIISVAPEPSSQKKIQSQDYRVTFQVEKSINNEQAPKNTIASSTNEKVKLLNLKENQTIASPFTLRGEARGTWFFEASFPIEVRDGNNKPILIQAVQTKEDWMTEKFVPFTTILTFTKPTTSTGTIILRKDNPSGETSRDESVTIPIIFK